MSGSFINESNLRKIFDAMCASIRNRTELESMFDKDSKLTLDTRKQGADEIAKCINQKERELQITTFSYLQIGPTTTLVNGDCIWGNRQSYFTTVLQHPVSSENVPQVSISNFMIF